MIILGTVMAIAAGLALPGHMLLFGGIINQFVFHQVAEGILANPMNATSNMTHFCSNATSGQGIVSNVDPFVMNGPDSTLLKQIGLYSLYYVGMATGVLIATFLATVFWNISAYRQTRRMRLAFYRSILRQEIGWFDVTEANELSTRLAE